MDNTIYGYTRAILNSVCAVMHSMEYDIDKIRAIKAILSVADPAALPLDLYDFGDKKDDRVSDMQRMW